MADLKIEQLLRAMVEYKASDLHIRAGVPPIYRINGTLTKLFETRVDSAMMDSFLDDIMNRDQKQRFEANKECDFAVGARDMGRFRVNVFRQRGTIAMVIRHIKAKIPAFEELHLPDESTGGSSGGQIGNYLEMASRKPSNWHRSHFHYYD